MQEQKKEIVFLVKNVDNAKKILEENYQKIFGKKDMDGYQVNFLLFNNASREELSSFEELRRAYLAKHCRNIEKWRDKSDIIEEKKTFLTGWIRNAADWRLDAGKIIEKWKEGDVDISVFGIVAGLEIRQRTYIAIDIQLLDSDFKTLLNESGRTIAMALYRMTSTITDNCYLINNSRIGAYKIIADNFETLYKKYYGEKIHVQRESVFPDGDEL